MASDAFGATDGGAPGPQATQRQPADVLLSWVEQLLRERVAPHVDRLLEVSIDLGSLLYDRGAGKLGEALRQVDAAIDALGDAIVRDPTCDAGAFRDTWQAAARGARRIDGIARDIGTWLDNNDANARRSIVELGMEQQRLRETLAQADQWLADSWGDLRQRRPSEGTAAHLDKLRALAARADALGARVRRLHAAGRAIEEACVLAEHVLTLRRALAQELLDVLQPRHAAWEHAMVRWLEAADAVGGASDVGPAQDHGGPLRVDLQRCIAGCNKLRQEEHALQRCVATTCELLRASD